MNQAAWILFAEGIPLRLKVMSMRRRMARFGWLGGWFFVFFFWEHGVDALGPSFAFSKICLEWLPELRKVTKWCAISVILAFLGQCQLRVHNWHTNLPYRSALAQGKSNGSGRRRRSRGDKVWNFEKQSNPKCFKILPWCQDGTDTCQLLIWWMKINRWCDW